MRQEEAIRQPEPLAEYFDTHVPAMSGDAIQTCRWADARSADARQRDIQSRSEIWNVRTQTGYHILHTDGRAARRGV